MKQLAIVWVVLVYANGMYIASGWWLLLHRWTGITIPKGIAHTVWKWTKWPALCQILLMLYFTVTGEPGFDSIADTAMLAIAWWLLRNAGDDDFKKKLKKKLSEVVKQVGDRLVIVAKVAH